MKEFKRVRTYQSRQSNLLSHDSIGSPCEYRIGEASSISTSANFPDAPPMAAAAALAAASHLCSWTFASPLFFEDDFTDSFSDSLVEIAAPPLVLLSRRSLISFKLSARPVPSYPFTVELMKVRRSPSRAFTMVSGIAAASSIATISADENLSG